MTVDFIFDGLNQLFPAVAGNDFFLIIAMLLSISGLDFVTSISGAASSISNVGPGLGEVIGPDGNYKSLPDLSKWILATGMLLGRLELFAVLVLFFPSFWRN